MKNGFTLVELLVSVGLFAVVVSIAVGGFVSVLRSQRQAAAFLAVNTNVGLAIEQMAREIRTGYGFCTYRSCQLSELGFINARGENITYRLANGGLERQVNDGAFQKITADNVEVKYVKFYLGGREANDGLQPRVTIALGVSPREAAISGNVFNLQTTVSARLPLDTPS